MKALIRQTLMLLILAAMTGCAAYPAVQVAGGAMTGYDAAILVDDYLPRDNIKGGELCTDADKMLQRRLRERLQMKGLDTVSAHVIARNAYLVGQVTDKKQADYAANTALSVKGLKTITVKFFPAPTLRQAQNDTLLLKKLSLRLAKTKRLEHADLRIEVIRSNAILIGQAADYSQKTAALAIASEVGGITQVVDYITITPKQDTDKIALR